MKDNMKKIISLLPLNKTAIDFNGGLTEIVALLEKNQPIKSASVTLQYSKYSYAALEDKINYLADVLSSNKISIESLRFRSKVCDQHVHTLSNAIKSNKSLKSLIFEEAIDYNGVIALGEMLKANNSMEKLIFRMVIDGPSNRLWLPQFGVNTQVDAWVNPNMKHEQLEIFMQGLAQNKTLKTLVIDHSIISTNGVKFIAEGLKKNQTLKLLDLSSNAISNEDADILKEALNSSLIDRTIVLDKNYLTTDDENVSPYRTLFEAFSLYKKGNEVRDDRIA